MAVNLSPLGGAGAQFFDNNGVILSGGKIYTYAAGTTTPQATYTSSTGATPHANPIVLNSAGRVSSGEIWLTDGLSYKFVIETSSGILLGTYDNVSGSKGASETLLVPSGYTTATNVQTAFDNLGSSAGTSKVGFLQAGTGAIVRTAQSKMRDVVSAKDFGAIGDGTLHMLSERYATLLLAQAVYPFATALTQSIDYCAIQMALNTASNGEFGTGRVVLPTGLYVLTNSIQIPSYVTFEGESESGAVLYNQVVPLAAPMMEAQDTVAFLGVTIRNLSVLGGTMVLRVNVTTSAAGNLIENLSCNLQTMKSMEFSTLETSLIRNCEFRGSRNRGLHFLGFPVNAVTLDHVRIGDVLRAPIQFENGYDLFTITNSSSIEAGATGYAEVTCQCSGPTMFVSAITGAPIEVGQLVVGDGIIAGTRVAAFGTGGGGGGTYTVTIPQTFTSRNAIISYASIDAEPGSVYGNQLIIRDTYFEASQKIVLHANGVSGTVFQGNKITSCIDLTGVIFSGGAAVSMGDNFFQTTAVNNPAQPVYTGQNINMPLDKNYTPTVTPLSGSFTALGAVSGAYRLLPGGLVRFSVSVAITTNGTAAGGIYVSLPYGPFGPDVCFGRENSVGFGLAGAIAAADPRVFLNKSSDGSYPGGNGYTLFVSGLYRYL